MDNNFIYFYLRYNNIYKILENIFTNDIINIIVKFIYIRKNKAFIFDIENFVSFKNNIIKLYYNKYANHSLQLYDLNLKQLQVIDYKYNLIIDLELYFYYKNNIGYNICINNFDLDYLILKLEKTNYNKHINISIGLLLPEERIEFYKLMKNNYIY